MKTRGIAAIEIDHSGRLLVRPETHDFALYEYVYREANGLRWDGASQAFYAYEPARWDHERLIRHIAATVRVAFGEQLCITAHTAWVGVAPELEQRLRLAITQDPGSP